jgi:hydroxyacylglutathione hydrolase
MNMTISSKVDQQRSGGARRRRPQRAPVRRGAHSRIGLHPDALRGSGSKLAWIADHEHDVVLVGRDDDDDGRRAAELATAIGMRRLARFLGGGMSSWRQEHWPTDVTRRLDAGDLPGWLAADDEFQVLDVRDPPEWDTGHLAGSVLVTWPDITRLPEGLDPDRRIAVICGSGQRAATGASLLRRHGARNVIHVVNGVPKLGRLGFPLDTGDAHA